ncbi:antibiotic biosynthesis monooxygenase [Candidatus Uabimicrobium sp. HlEnr_7]|uniref:antibiotic biosynthesis monooxygenase family protein n=1 Tax=Candidatus Uabimicrobium helgolandensis TaxID=3095367 RepID=UPI0035592F88
MSDSYVQVFVRCETNASIYEEVSNIASLQLELFQKQPGYINGTVFKSKESQTILTHLQWKTLADHEACLKNPDWHNNENSQKFLQWIQESKIKIKPEVYEIIAATNQENC